MRGFHGALGWKNATRYCVEMQHGQFLRCSLSHSLHFVWLVSSRLRRRCWYGRMRWRCHHRQCRHEEFESTSSQKATHCSRHRDGFIISYAIGCMNRCVVARLEVRPWWRTASTACAAHALQSPPVVEKRSMSFLPARGASYTWHYRFGETTDL